MSQFEKGMQVVVVAEPQGREVNFGKLYWNPRMDATCGKIGTVDYEHNNTIHVKFEDGASWYYLPEWIKPCCSFEEDEPVMVVEGGWGLYPALEDTIIHVKSVSGVFMDSTRYLMTLSRKVKEPKPHAEREQEAGTHFAPRSIRKLTVEEREAYELSLAREVVKEACQAAEIEFLRKDNATLRARVWELELALKRITTISEAVK